MDAEFVCAAIIGVLSGAFVSTLLYALRGNRERDQLREQLKFYDSSVRRIWREHKEEEW